MLSGSLGPGLSEMKLENAMFFPRLPHALYFRHHIFLSESGQKNVNAALKTDDESNKT